MGEERDFSKDSRSEQQEKREREREKVSNHNANTLAPPPPSPLSTGTGRSMGRVGGLASPVPLVFPPPFSCPHSPTHPLLVKEESGQEKKEEEKN